MFESFKVRAEAVGAVVRRVASRESALDAVAAILRDEGVADAPGAHAVWAADAGLPTERQRALAASVAGLSFDVTRGRAAEARAGVSTMDWGLADTGSIAQDATAVALRLVSTLPIAHVALLPVDAILPDLATLLPRLSPGAMRYLSVITGPSRTADIERVLTIGVHGPECLYIVCYDRAEN